MNVHFIAIGGAIMHNLAICLQNIGHQVSGSDDVIYNPAKNNLAKAGLLPREIGFYAKNIHADLDAIILGMHAKKDNVELIKAQALGIRIYSFPEFIYEQSKTKKRIVIAGSHGKTTTTAMVMHVMKKLNFSFDYLVGSSLEGFDLSVQLSNAPIIVLEGDEYLSSPIEMTSKFHYYDPDIAVITGVAWDHVNVFPTWESYVKTFKDFLGGMRASSTAILYQKDSTLKMIAKDAKCKVISYTCPSYRIENEQSIIDFKGKDYPLITFGKHNLENMEAAKQVCLQLGIDDDQFYHAISSFKGTAKRLEKIKNQQAIIAYRDFAHSPSKLEATMKSVREQFAKKQLIACMELHTFSSTDKSFLAEYKDAMRPADHGVIYMSSHAFQIKNRKEITDQEVRDAFNQQELEICRTPEQLKAYLQKVFNKDHVYLLMSSGSFDGIDWTTFFNTI